MRLMKACRFYGESTGGYALVTSQWAADNNSRKRIIGIHEVIKNKRG